MVRLWEIPRDAKRNVKPTQIEGFYVEATTQNDALVSAKSELRDKRRRVVRSISMRPDGVINAVIFTDEKRQARGTPAAQSIRQVTSLHLRRRSIAAQVAQREAQRPESTKTPRAIDEINKARAQRASRHMTAKLATHDFSQQKPISIPPKLLDRAAQLQQQREEQQADDTRALERESARRGPGVSASPEQRAKAQPPTRTLRVKAEG